MSRPFARKRSLQGWRVGPKCLHKWQLSLRQYASNGRIRKSHGSICSDIESKHVSRPIQWLKDRSLCKYEWTYEVCVGKFPVQIEVQGENSSPGCTLGWRQMHSNSRQRLSTAVSTRRFRVPCWLRLRLCWYWLWCMSGAARACGASIMY